VKLLAVRMREVGPFVRGVALEGLSGGIDVLAGPNELGKSTLFRALQAVFFENHTTTQKEIERLRPYSGGAPLIEADFEMPQGRWRIRKQFLSGKAAELVDLNTGRIAARGRDADNLLAQMVGNGDGKRGEQGRFALLWVPQKCSLDDVTVVNGSASALNGAIEREVEAVAGGASARAVRERVATELAALVTPSQARPTGRFAAAKSELQRLESQLAAAEAAELRAAGRMATLAELLHRREILTDPERQAELAGRLAASAAALAAGREAAQALQLAAERLKLAMQAAAEAGGKLTAYDAAMAEEARLRQAAAGDETQLAAAHEAAVQAGSERDRLVSLAARRRRAERTGRLAAVRSRVAEVAELDEGIRQLQRRLHMNGASAPILAKLEAEDRAILALESQLLAAAASLRFEYAADGHGRITIAGRAPEAGSSLSVVAPVVIEIAGVGRITVAPGSLTDRAEIEADLAAHRLELAHVLATLGVATLDAALALGKLRRELESELAAKRSRQQALAPDGLNRLRAELADLAAAINVDADTEPATDSGAVRALNEPEHTPVSETQLRAAHTTAMRAEREEVRLKTLVEERRRQLDQLSQRLPSAGERAACRHGLSSQLAQCEAALNEAVRTHSAWAEQAPPAPELGKREAAWRQAVAAQEASLRERHRLDLEIRGEEAALAQDGEAGTGLRRAELAGELARAREQVAAFEAEAATLGLLREALETAAQCVRASFLMPVTSRLDPFLRLVFPTAQICLGRDVTVTGLMRSEADELLEALSIGTREQIAVLVRLAFGKLFADTGAAAPVLLDDALVYSDDERLARMFAALRLAAESHQVIVLTCRTAAFDALGGRRLQLMPWDPLATAA